MIDFHTHTLLSDGVLIPSEQVRRAAHIGYRAIGLTDHVDGSNLEDVVPRIAKVAKELNRFQEVLTIPGAEITHAPPGQIRELVQAAKKLGAVLVVVHGETPAEPVAPGTNRAGIESGADILAHPGFITPDEARLAAELGVFLEITARSGHNLTNGHVARIASVSGARLVINTDAHAPGDMITRARAMQVLIGAGMTEAQAGASFNNNEQFLETLKQRLS
ncbi:histidinol phosphate phosphatase domain-containing protein [Desulfomonile tiedjei]|uniref:PHP family phosphohydrolase, histidinol phosphatase n=1 Tax=Desulfomonile tiedjei (strain ATCC 49306 / DSM 6799 / DCB-1) TaxID=706587 RepID=I4CCF9_DESTA|nr:histidinol phosphate phosphatase domain-containing protein [Desulfomonile tiedjei]AFM27250.1 PHP family phosphohydrolase, histidinol phosphatase [Desulfomonile tiedjei DSM 6799]